MADPAFYSGNFAANINPSVAPPTSNFTMGYLGSYIIAPAMMTLTFTGQVRLPPGIWDVGMVQNLLRNKIVLEYRQGGIWTAEPYGGPWLDILDSATDIWLNTLTPGFVTIINNSTSDRLFPIQLTAGDTPRIPPISAKKTRCNGKIEEVLVSARESSQFRAVLIARAHLNRTNPATATFPLVATKGTYGYVWEFTVKNDRSPNPDWLSTQPLFPSGLIRPPFNVDPHTELTLELSKRANSIVRAETKKAEARYVLDCSRL